VIKRGEHFFVTRFQDNVFLPLDLTPHGYLHFRQLACVNDKEKVIVEDCRYIYSLSADPDDEDSWIFRHEYSLTPDENVPYAHFHLNAYCNQVCIKHIHFPTGRISIEQIIAHLILEHGITPRMDDWFSFLSSSHAGFVRKRNDILIPYFP
jgi:hypothetical protein